LVGSLALPFETRVLELGGVGAAGGRNRGGREARNPVVVWLDDDVVPEPAFLAEHAGSHGGLAHERVVLGYYPPVIEHDSLWGLRLRAWWEDHFRRKAEPRHEWTYIDVVSGNLSMPRELFLRSGGFDESFAGRGREDWEFGIRLLRQGVRLAYQPRAVGQHYLDASFRTALRNCRSEAAGDVLLATRHPEVAGHLPLAFSLYARREPHRHLIEPALPVLDALEAMRLRRRWQRLTVRLLNETYAVGLSDVFSRDGFLEFIAPIQEESAAVVRVDLAGGSPVRLPPGVGPVTVQVSYAGHELGRIRALDALAQWDWQEITNRVAWTLAERDDVRRALPLDDFVAGVESADRLVQSGVS
jgi:hypothetical protein